MATTTNFGWETPDDTDLVKDGALAIRTLGSAIDTSLVDLKGGTTGQVLSKTSNTDMDFTWVTSDDANAIQNAIVDAKGDLIAASAADTPARLAVGNNGETLVADSSTSTGLRWQATESRNGCYNSAFDVWQRGTSFAISTDTTGALNYTADRWQGYRAATGSTLSRQNAGSLGTTPAQIATFAARLQRDSGNTFTSELYLLQALENADSAAYLGKTVTLSFYARAGANFSAASSILTGAIVTGTGTNQNQFTFTNFSVAAASNFTLTTSWQRFQMTVTLGTTPTQVGWRFYYAPTGTAGANDWFEITAVKFEVGSIATTFCRMSGTLAGELAACQRYYYRFVPNGVNTSWIGSGFAYATGTFLCSVRLPVTMRVNPTSIETSGTASHYRMLVGSTVATASGVPTLDTANWDNTVLAVSTSGLTVGQGGILGFNSTASGYIGFVAEL